MINGTAVRCVCCGGDCCWQPMGSAAWCRPTLEPPEVEMPDWTFRDIAPAVRQLARRRREAGSEDRRGHRAERRSSTASIGTTRDTPSRMHTAMFDEPGRRRLPQPADLLPVAADGRSSQESRENLRVSDDLTIPVSLTTWEREGEKVMVVYWYQFGEHVLFGRWDLGAKVRWSLRGQAEMAGADQSDDADPATDRRTRKPTDPGLRGASREVGEPARASKGMDCWTDGVLPTTTSATPLG